MKETEERGEVLVRRSFFLLWIAGLYRFSPLSVEKASLKTSKLGLSGSSIIDTVKNIGDSRYVEALGGWERV